MHTDEFEISLSRELAVCKNSIRRIETILEAMKKKYHFDSDAFIQKFQNKELTPCSDFTAWAENHEALKKWTTLHSQYEDLYRMMKL